MKRLPFVIVNGFDAKFVQSVGVVLFSSDPVLLCVVPVEMTVRNVLRDIMSI